MRSLLCYLVAALTVVYSILPVSSFEKKSDMSEFTSAINGASRLRYGKRSFDVGYPLNALREPIEYEDPYTQYAKRAPLTNKLIQSLNGAERLSGLLANAVNVPDISKFRRWQSGIIFEWWTTYPSQNVTVCKPLYLNLFDHWMYTSPPFTDLPSPAASPGVHYVRNDSWSRGELQLMGLATVVIMMSIAFFGIALLNCCGRLQGRMQRSSRQKAVYFIPPPPYSALQPGGQL